MAYNEEKTQLTETEIGPGMTQMIDRDIFFKCNGCVFKHREKDAREVIP